ncbi:MAG: ABC transporter permease [Paracoccaceae bacterium]|nr:ABC transporter permease [Paracoccaceae bacterium]
MNFYAVWSIYKFEMARAMRTLFQSFLAPVISTSLYFIVFGTAIGSKIPDIEGINYGAFIVPGLIMLSVITQSLSNAAFGIFMPKYNGTIYEILSAPISPLETIIGYVGAAATKSIFIGLIILITATLFISFNIKHLGWMLVFLFLTSVSFSLFGFIIGIWATNWEKLNLIPLILVTPLVFLGGTFYSISMLPALWQIISKFNPVLYLVSGFRWSFFGTSDVPIFMSVMSIFIFIALCLFIIFLIFKTGYRLRE